MEFQKIVNLLEMTSDDKDLPRFVTKTWIEVYDKSGKNCSVNKEIRIKTPMLRSDVCDFSDSCMTMQKTHDNAEDLDVVMPMYYFLEYSKNYRKTTGRLCNYYRDEPNNPLFSNSESLKYRTTITGKLMMVMMMMMMQTKLIKMKTVFVLVEVVTPLKHLSNFWRPLNIPLINCEIELILASAKNCALADITVRAAENDKDPPAIVGTTGLEFRIKDTKLYVPVVTLSKENDKKFLEQLKSGFKRTTKLNKYRSQMIIHSNDSNLNYLIDPAFTNVKRLFVLLFERIGRKQC